MLPSQVFSIISLCLLFSTIFESVNAQDQLANTSTLLPCETLLDCFDANYCYNIRNDGYLDDCTSKSCVCVGVDEDETCDSSGSCFIGSACMSLISGAQASYCIPCASRTNRNPEPQQIDDDDVCSISSYSHASSGEMLSSCSTLLDCSASRSCSSFLNDGTLKDCDKSETSDCFCLDEDTTCSSSSECVVNYACAKITTNAPGYCVPCSSLKNRSPVPTIDDNSVCEVTHSSSSSSDEDTTLASCESLLSCGNSEDCLAVTNGGDLVDCTDEADCFCIDDDIECTSSSTCASGYGCAKISGSTNAFCIPCDAVGRKDPPPAFIDTLHSCSGGSTTDAPAASPSTTTPGTPQESPPNTTPDPSETNPSTSSSAATSTSPPAPTTAATTQEGLSFERCSADDPSFCEDPRSCLDTGDGVNPSTVTSCTTSSELCVCVPSPIVFCDSSLTCAKGERCVSAEGRSLCASCKASNFGQETVDDGAGNCEGSGSGSGSEPCIAVDSLGHFLPEELVYKTHKRASVLCDASSNCATPGHIVSYKGAAMMMVNYCNKVDGGCKKTVKLVNNPKMKAGMRVSSNSDHLWFTVFSARYESRLEETLIKMIIRTGM